jgi:ATP adenylyltransferase
MKSSQTHCIFCEVPSDQWVYSTRNWFVVKDGYPVTEGHLLILPKQHRLDFFELSDDEQSELPELLKILKAKICADDRRVSGFNIGANCGESAGQSVFHCHIHLIPRRVGDVANPKGGVRGVIPSKQNY